VYAAWTEPEHLKQWWGPEGFVSPSAEIDLRVGGRYRAGMRAPDGTEMAVVGEYTEITPPERIVFTWAWDPPMGGPEETLVTVEFRDLGDMTELALTHERFLSVESRDQHQHGWESTFVCLEQAL
jgi:uncharacterized protein YndB with AHSA1/START domain